MNAARNYYYLVAGLPDILLEQAKPPFSVVDFREELRYHLHADDFTLVKLVLLQADNANLLRILNKDHERWDERGQFTHEQMDAAVRDEEGLPSYMHQLVAAYRQELPIQPHMSWENQISHLYYEYAIEITEGFLADWFAFDRDLRNILAALSARKHHLALEGNVLGEHDIAQTIRHTNARDFGLTGELAFLEKLLQIEEETNLFDREFAIDKLRWQYIDELNTFHYFSVDVLLGYMLKLFMLERWKPLDDGDGKTTFKGLITGLKNSFEFPKEFVLS
jgi:hypothetical protein